jgi:sensor c-di-GMP phosphodiesterase-like protein
MMLVPKCRACVAAIAILLAAAGGATGGYLLGRVHARHMAEASLANSAAKLEGMLDSFLHESNSLLNTLNTSGTPTCSQAEIAWFRKLIYHSTYLRDAGRMHGGRMECSADFGAVGLPRTSFHPNSSTSDGFNIYANLPPYASGKWPVFLLQKGDSYVVEDPGFERQWEAIYKDYDVFFPSGPAHRWLRPNGRNSHIRGAIVSRDWQGLLGDTVYATRCSAATHSCTVAYGSYAAALYADRFQLVLFAALGALSSVLIVLAYLFVYQHSRSMSQQLRRAIRRDKLRMVYQPIVDLATRRIVEIEALARWTDEDGFAVRPDIFVRIAEERGFVGELTELVVRHALRDFGQLLRRDPGFRLNINVTASDLVDDGFLPMLERSLQSEGVAAPSLVIEVTESSTARRLAAIHTIHQLRRRGHSVQIDDFGTGYSSLAYLKDLAVDAIKIDKAFTQAIGTEAVIGHILPQILAMAESLDLMVIVEGIETEEQARYFAGSQRPLLGQGWLFGRPVRADELNAMLAADEIPAAQSYPAAADMHVLMPSATC